MAEVTYGTPAAIRHVLGDLVLRLFVVSGASGSVIHTGAQGILFVSQQMFTQAGTASLLTGISVSGAVVTLTSSSTMVNEVIMVISKA